MNHLSKKIKEILSEQNISASSVEKKAGIGPSSLQNILQGRVKNPSLEIIKSIAGALGYTTSELLGEIPESSRIINLMREKQWDQELYLNILRSILSIYELHQLKVSKLDILESIEYIYDYCLQYNKKKPDKDFVEWTILQKNS